jgi:hypothetical protein
VALGTEASNQVNTVKMGEELFSRETTVRNGWPLSTREDAPALRNSFLRMATEKFPEIEILTVAQLQHDAHLLYFEWFTRSLIGRRFAF